MIDFFLALDRDLFLFLNGLHHPILDEVMYYISHKYTWVPLYIIIFAFVFKAHGWRTIYYLLFVVVLITLSDQSSLFMKETLMRLRPCHEPMLQGLVHTVRGRCGGQHGFVSSHAANTFALAVFVIATFRTPPVMILGGVYYRALVIVMLAYAILNGYSRIYLGVHYPADVFFGSVLGAGIGFAVHAVYRKLYRVMFSQLTEKPRHL